jgi:hypothetical protein
VADIKRFKPINGVRRALVNFTVGENYATANGGFVITPALLGFTGIIDIRPPTLQLDGATTPILHVLVAQPITASVNWGLRAYEHDATPAEEADGASGFAGEAIRLDVLGY